MGPEWGQDRRHWTRPHGTERPDWRPEAPTLDQRPEHAEILDALGGVAWLDERVSWYRGVILG